MAGAVDAAVRAGRLEEAEALIVAEIRDNPGAFGPRLALFQLSALTGAWDRALRQLETAERLEKEAAAFAATYRALLAAEAVRAEVVTGRSAPVCMGEPPPWMAHLVQALALDAEGRDEAADGLRREVMDMAGEMPGELDGQAFTWICDADPRFGPTLELVANGAYRWLPLAHLRELTVEPPSSLRDVVWLPARLRLATGGELGVFLFARYPGSEASEDAALRMARATSWRDRVGGLQTGLGQRLLATDGGDHPLLDLRHLAIGRPGHG